MTQTEQTIEFDELLRRARRDGILPTLDADYVVCLYELAVLSGNIIDESGSRYPRSATSPKR